MHHLRRGRPVENCRNAANRPLTNRPPCSPATSVPAKKPAWRACQLYRSHVVAEPKDSGEKGFYGKGNKTVGDDDVLDNLSPDADRPSLRPSGNAELRHLRIQRTAF
jgi:hypothetical protein